MLSNKCNGQKMTTRINPLVISSLILIELLKSAHSSHYYLTFNQRQGKLLSENEICDRACSRSFNCDWGDLTHLEQIQFPDGTTQTCVGTQVRCKCTFIMDFISNFTYENPRSVVVGTLLIGTFFLVLLIRRIVLKGCIEPWLILSGRSKSTGQSCDDYQNDQDYRAELAEAFGQMNLNYFVESDKPPSYTHAVSQKKPPRDITDSPPPSYKECMQNVQKY